MAILVRKSTAINVPGEDAGGALQHGVCDHDILRVAVELEGAHIAVVVAVEDHLACKRKASFEAALVRFPPALTNRPLLRALAAAIA